MELVGGFSEMDPWLVGRTGVEGFPCVPGKVPGKGNVASLGEAAKSAGRQGIFPVISAVSSLDSL